MSVIDPTYFNQFYINPSYPSDLESEFEVDYDIEEKFEAEYSRKKEIEKIEKQQSKINRDVIFMRDFDLPKRTGLYVMYLNPKRIHMLFDLTEMAENVDPVYVYVLKIKYDRKWERWRVIRHRMPSTANALDIFIYNHISDEFLLDAIFEIYKNVKRIAQSLSRTSSSSDDTE